MGKCVCEYFLFLEEGGLGIENGELRVIGWS